MRKQQFPKTTESCKKRIAKKKCFQIQLQKFEIQWTSEYGRQAVDTAVAFVEMRHPQSPRKTNHCCTVMFIYIHKGSPGVGTLASTLGLGGEEELTWRRRLTGTYLWQGKGRSCLNRENKMCEVQCDTAGQLTDIKYLFVRVRYMETVDTHSIVEVYMQRKCSKDS